MTVVVLFQLITLSWITLEAALVVRELRSRPASVRLDRRSYAILSGSIITAIVIAAAFSSHTRPEPRLELALAVLLVGVALRFWAVQTLGRAFRVVVAVGESPQLMTGGPYRLLRHPSYTGLLLALIGTGLANGSTVSLAVLIVLPVPAVLWRIHVEEAALSETFGSAWHDYARRTRRLVPGLW